MRPMTDSLKPTAQDAPVYRSVYRVYQVVGCALAVLAIAAMAALLLL